MAELTFQVFGHNNKHLDVVFCKSGKNLTASCACNTNPTEICQHIINILSGSTRDIISGNSDDVKKLASWIVGTDVGKAMHHLLDCAKRLENATEDLADARKRLVKALHD
ncbi:MAG: hypothetical protein HQL96_12480 [Magnetococcales bacterium]|nr:hypothetical protein [Magnetococcales bacterium]